MNPFKWADARVKALGVWDIGLLKVAVALFGIVIGAYAAAFVQQYVAWFLGAAAALTAWLLFRFFRAPTP